MAAARCRRAWCAILVAGLLATDRSPSQEPVESRPSFVAPLRARPAVVDGRLDEWGDEPSIRLDSVEQVWSQRNDPAMRWEGPDDLSMALWIGYDAAHLYIAGRVRDDDLVPGKVGSEWHLGDAIELFFDLGDPARGDGSGEFDEDVLQLFLMPFSQERPWGVMDWRQRPAAPSGASLTGVTVVFERRPDEPGEYTFEAVVPFHNFPRIRGRPSVGFSVAVDDHDASRPGRYQYVSWTGEQLIDQRHRLGEMAFAGLLPLASSPEPDAGYGWLGEGAAMLLLPALLAFGVAALTWGWIALSRRVRMVGTVGRVVGVLMFVVGLLLPTWAIERRSEAAQQRLREVVETLQAEVPRMEDSLLGSYRGGERDRVLVDVLAGGSIVREQKFRYTFHAAIADDGPVIGAGTRAFPGLGFEVRPYGIPLPLDELELFGFREPLAPGRLNVVVARPLGAAGPLYELPFDDVPVGGDVVVLELAAYGPGGESSPAVLEVPGPFVPTSDPALDRMEVSYRTLTIDSPLESLGIACRQGEGVRLVGLTWVSPVDVEPQQDPLYLGVDTLGGVPTELRGPWPRTAGVELRENGGTASIPLPADRAADFRKLWLIYGGVYRTRPAEPLGVGGHVCELTIEYAEPDEPPQVVAFQHQRSMFFGADRANREQPSSDEVAVAQRWQGEDGEPRLDVIREIDLRPGLVPVSLRLRNTGPYAIRFRSAVFGSEVQTVATSTADSPLVRQDGGGEVLRAEILERIAGVDLAVYRNGRLSASMLPGLEQQERTTLPDEARRAVPDDRVVERVVSSGDGVVHESYAVLRGEAWSGTVLAALFRDHDRGEFIRSMNRVGVGLWLGALPVLLLIFSEILAVLNNLRLRLVSVLSVATLLPLLALSLILVRVIEGDHEERLHDRARQAVASVEKQLGDDKAQLLVSAQSWLQDLVETLRERQAAEPDPESGRLEDVLRPIMESQMPPAWGESGYMLFEFSPLPDSSESVPVSVDAGGATMRSLDTQLRSEVGVYLVWSVPLVGVRCSTEIEGLGVCALSVARRLDPDFLSSLGRDKAVLLCDSSGYPVTSAGSEAVSSEALERHAARPGVQAERKEVLRALEPGAQPVVRRHAAPAGVWLASYVPLLDLQDTPRLLLGLFEVDAAATLPLEIGRIPIRVFFAGAAGLLLVLSLFLSFIVSTRISRPIERLESGAQALGRGEFDVQIESEEGGQIGRLTRSFNQMATELRGRIQDLRLLNRGIQELTSKLDVADVVQSATAFFARHAPADTVRLILGGRDEGLIGIAGQRHATFPVDAPDVAPLLRATGPCCLVFNAEGGALAEAFPGHRSALALPLLMAGRPRGVVLLLFESDRPADVDLDLLWAMAAQAAAAIENARLYQMAVEDVHTGALRRDYFATRVAEEVAHAEREGLPLCLIGIRLQHGRAIAAELGEDRAAQVVEGMVAAVRAELPEDVLICRAGQVELQVLLRAQQRCGEEEVARLRDALGDVGAEIRTDLQPVVVDVAVAAFPEEAASAEFLFAALEVRLTPGAASLPQIARDPGSGIVLSSPSMAGVLRTIEKVAPTDLSILLLGDTGTGKEVLCDLIHRWSTRAPGPLVKVHCAALSETLLASELFGHEKGAFTGAIERKLGRFEKAEGGTIFLDEIGEISHEVQVKLLRVLQEREIDRVGGVQPVPVDVRVVAATNRDIEQMVTDGRFREDLYYRLQGMMVRVPPLRERREEIPALIELFRRQAVAAGHADVDGFTSDAMDELYRRDWPGNIRELRNTVFRAMVLAAGPRVTRADVLGISGPTDLVEPGLSGRSAVGSEPIRSADAEPAAESARVVRAAPAPADPEPSAAEGLPGPLVRTAGASAPHLGGRLLDLYRFVGERGSVSSQEYAEWLGISPRTALRDLGKLTDEGLLARVGRRRGARYRLANSGESPVSGEIAG